MHCISRGYYLFSPGPRATAYQHYKPFIALAVPLVSMASVVQTIILHSSHAEQDPYARGEGLVTSYTRSCSGAPYRAAPIRLQLHCVTIIMQLHSNHALSLSHAFEMIGKHAPRNINLTLKGQLLHSSRTTPRIASHQTLSPHVRVWLHETITAQLAACMVIPLQWRIQG